MAEDTRLEIDSMSQEDLKLLRKQINGKITRTNKAQRDQKGTIRSLFQEIGNGVQNFEDAVKRATRVGPGGDQLGEDGQPFKVRYTLLQLLKYFMAQRAKKYSKTFTTRDGHTATFLQVLYTANMQVSYNRAYLALLSNAQVVYGSALYNMQTPGEWMLKPEPEERSRATIENRGDTIRIRDRDAQAREMANGATDPPPLFSDSFITALEELPVKPTQRVWQAIVHNHDDGSDNPQHALNKIIVSTSEKVFNDMGDAASRAILRGADTPLYPSLGEWVDVCLELSSNNDHEPRHHSAYGTRHRVARGISNEHTSFPLLTRVLSTTNLIVADFGPEVQYEGIFANSIVDMIREGVEEQRTIDARATVLEEAVAMKLGFIHTDVGWLKISFPTHTRANNISLLTDAEIVDLVRPFQKELTRVSVDSLPRLLKGWSPCVMVTHESTCFVNGGYRCIVDATSVPLPKGDQTARRMLMFASTYRDTIYTLTNDKKMLEDLFADVPYATIRECRELVVQRTGGPKAAPLENIQLD